MTADGKENELGIISLTLLSVSLTALRLSPLSKWVQENRAYVRESGLDATILFFHFLAKADKFLLCLISSLTFFGVFCIMVNGIAIILTNILGFTGISAFHLAHVLSISIPIDCNRSDQVLSKYLYQ